MVSHLATVPTTPSILGPTQACVKSNPTALNTHLSVLGARPGASPDTGFCWAPNDHQGAAKGRGLAGGRKVGPRKGEGSPLPRGPGCLVPLSPFLGQTSVLFLLESESQGPEDLGVQVQKRHSFDKALAFSDPGQLSPYLSPP